MLFTVSTVKDTRANLERFVDGNLTSGADHMFVFLEGDDEKARRYLLGRPDVTTVVTDERYWAGRRPHDLNRRQIVNANLVNCLLAPLPWAQWLVHLDGDECLEIDRNALFELRHDVRAVRLSPLESVSQETPSEVTYFKRKLGDDELALLTSLGAIEGPDNRSYFSGHVVGKAAFRPALDLDIGLHRPTVREGPGFKLQQGPFHVLHYESFSMEEFLRKWSAHLTGGARHFRAERSIVGGAIAAVLANHSLDDAAKQRYLREIYKRHIEDPADLLLELGLLVTPRAEYHQHQPASLTGRRQQQVTSLLDRLLAVDKRRFAPRLGVQAAIGVMREVRGALDPDVAGGVDDAIGRAEVRSEPDPPVPSGGARDRARRMASNLRRRSTLGRRTGEG